MSERIQQTYSSATAAGSLRNWSKRLFAVLFGIGLAWLSLEVLLRVAYPLFPYTIQAALREVRLTPFTEKRILPQQIWQADDNYQLISRSNIDSQLQFPDPRVGIVVTTKNWLDPDSHVGFRVPSMEWQPRWPVDAVVVGDSFSFCYTEYDSCWVQRLADEHGMSVVNLGQVATGSISRLNLLKTFGLLHEPDLVIWQWYGNDFNDDYGMALMNGSLDQESAPESQGSGAPPPHPFVRWLEKHSAVYWIVRTYTSSKQDRYTFERFVDPFRAELGDAYFTFGRPYTLKAFDMSDPKNRIGLSLSQESILQASERLSEAGVFLLLVLVPSKEEVYRPWTEDVLGLDQIEALGEGRRQMATFCAEHGLSCLDPTPALAEPAASGKHVYWPDDSHLNDLGNQILANAVWNFLVENEFVTASGP